MSTNVKSSHLRHYLIVVTGMLMTFGPVSFALGCAGIFFTPVITELDASLSALSPYLTVLSLTMMVVLPFYGKMIQKYDVRVLLSIAVVLFGITMFAMGSLTAIWQFYVAGALLGLALPWFLYIAIPTLINRWFRIRVGFFMGLCFAFSGVGGVVFNALGGYLINSFGYATGYRTFGVLAIVLCLPFTLFAIRNEPADLGLLPYGAEESGDTVSLGSQAPVRGVSASVAMKMPAFYALAVFGGLVTLVVQMYAFFPSWATTVPLSAAAIGLGATLASMVSLGQGLGKIGLGAIADKSVSGAMLTQLGGGLVGLLVLWLLPVHVSVVLGAGLLFGLFYAGALVNVPMITRKVFGNRDYPQIYARVSSFVSLVSAFGAAIWGLVVDWAGGFSSLFAIGVTLIVVCLLLGSYSLRAGSRLEHTVVDEMQPEAT